MVSRRNKNFPRESDDVVGSSCSKDLTPLVILDEETINHSCYIKKVLRIALECGNEVFGDTWIFQHDRANPHRDHLTEK